MDNANRMEALIYCLDAEGITPTLLSGALAMTHKELDDKLYRGVSFTPDEQAVIRRLCNLSDQETAYIFGAHDVCQVKSEKT